MGCMGKFEWMEEGKPGGDEEGGLSIYGSDGCNGMVDLQR